jgi:hypothetical protein
MSPTASTRWPLPCTTHMRNDLVVVGVGLGNALVFPMHTYASTFPVDLGVVMQIRTYNLDGSVGPAVDVVQDASLQLRLDGLPVLAVSVWGAKVALSLTTRIVLIQTRDYARITKSSGLGWYGLDDLR